MKVYWTVNEILNYHATRLMVLIAKWRLLLLDSLCIWMTKKNYFEIRDLNSFWKKHQFHKAVSYLCRGDIFNDSAVYVIQGTNSWELMRSECLLAYFNFNKSILGLGVIKWCGIMWVCCLTTINVPPTQKHIFHKKHLKGRVPKKYPANYPLF